MQTIRTKPIFPGITIILSIAFFLPSSAFATLGQNNSSIAIDASQLGIVNPNADLQTMRLESSGGNQYYSIYQMTTMSGIEIKQFYYNDKVFAIVWQGDSAPNLSLLFGKYFHIYESATPKYKSSTLQSIEQQDFIAYVGNAHGQYYGKAMIPSLTPDLLNYTSIK